MQDYAQYIVPLKTGRWYTGAELEAIWNIPYNTRKQRIQQLVKRGYLIREGVTTSTCYKSSSPKTNIKPKLGIKKKPLDKLIDATAAVGTENELLKQTLRDICTMINKALEES